MAALWADLIKLDVSTILGDVQITPIYVLRFREYMNGLFER